MTDLTAANVSIALTIPGVFDTPQIIKGFATDDVYDFDEIESVEAVMGVDGILSGGWTWKPQPQRFMLQANSPSAIIFDTWQQQQAATRQTYPASGVVRAPSLGLKFLQTNGLLTGYKLPGAKKLMQPRNFRIMWNLVIPQPA